jgi:hypothetical protein
MASGGERRMVFDTRGRRKHVIRVVYAILAILMGTSLFLVVGPVNLGALIGNQTSSSNAAKVFEEQAERIEGRLAKDPTDEDLLLALTRARIGAGNAQAETDPATGAQTQTPESRAEFGAASQAWKRYLKEAGGEPNANAAQLVAVSFFKLAESSTSFREAEASIATAVAAQQIAAEQRPSLGSLSTLAIYQYFNGEFATADETTKQAAAKAPSKAEGKSVEKQLAEYRKNAEKFAKQKKELNKVEREVGKEKLTGPNPFSGLTGPGSAPGG